MKKHSDLDTRMKTYYEQISKIKLMKRCPVICRIDGRAFHTFTRGFKKPFDDVLIKTMQETAKYLCENVQGCVLAYTESDELSLLLIDYQKLDSDAFFNYEVQKLCSVISSMATLAFNKFFSVNVQDFGYECCYDPDNNNLGDEVAKGREEDYARYEFIYMKKLYTAMFDARVFNIPKEEVTNYFYSRQLNSIRNSVQMVGREKFGHKELKNKSRIEIQNMLMEQKCINWSSYPTYQKRGSCVIYKQKEKAWVIDRNIPIFKDSGREYIDQLVYIGE